MQRWRKHRNCSSGSTNCCTARRTTAPRIRQSVVRWSLGRRGDDDGRVWGQVQGEESGRPWAGEPPVSLPPRPCSVTCSHPHTTPLQLWSHLTSLTAVPFIHRHYYRRQVPQTGYIHISGSRFGLLTGDARTSYLPMTDNIPKKRKIIRNKSLPNFRFKVQLANYWRDWWFETRSTTHEQVFQKHVSIIWLKAWFLQRSYC